MSAEMIVALVALLGVAGKAFHWLLQREREAGRAESYRSESQEALAAEQAKSAAEAKLRATVEAELSGCKQALAEERAKNAAYRDQLAQVRSRLSRRPMEASE